MYEILSQGNQNEELDYHLGKLCIPHGERNNIIREAHISLIVGHFGVGKTIVNLQRYCYWQCMIDSVSRFIRGCSLCEISKPGNRKLGSCTLIHIPSHPWERISMDFVGGLLMLRKGHDYLYVVVDRFKKMCLLMPCKKAITTE